MYGSNRVICVQAPHFMWECEIERNPDLAGRHAVIIGDSMHLPGEAGGQDRASGQRVVLDFAPDIQGLVPGEPVEAVTSSFPRATLVEFDQACYSAVHDELLSAVESALPEVEDAGLGCAYAPISGLEKLYGGEKEVLRRVTEAVLEVGRQRSWRIGIGPNKWVAFVAASMSRDHAALSVTGEQGRFLDPLSIDLLPVEHRLKVRLRSFGLETLGLVAGLSEGAMAAQFGAAGQRIWELCNGIDNRPIFPRRHIEAVTEYLEFPDATSSLSVIMPGIESLLTKAFTRPLLARRFVRQADLHARVLRKVPWMLSVAFKEPVNRKDRALLAIQPKLNSVAIPGPLEDLRLTLSGLSSDPWHQESMWKEVQHEEHIRQAMQQLSVRIGTTPPVYQVRELEPWSRIPERRHALVLLSP